jgi:nucleoside-diphosphate-sugar epimerase
MEYRGRRVLVLGASGFIGRWVARHLTSAGADLVLAVRDPAAARALAAPYRIRGEILPVDLESPGSVGSLVSATLPAIVFNLAGYGVDSTERDATRSRRINADVVGELLEALHEHPAADWPGLRLVHTGSAL